MTTTKNAQQIDSQYQCIDLMHDATAELEVGADMRGPIHLAVSPDAETMSVPLYLTPDMAVELAHALLAKAMQAKAAGLT